jgi:deazaflavin-dependent oxidoreductase (nitroreductase family)
MMLAAGSLPVLDRFIGSELLGKSNLRIRDLAQQDSPLTSVNSASTFSNAPSSRTTPKFAGKPDARAMFVRSPSPLLRVFFSAPRWLYRLGLGRLLGYRFMLLTHRGRTSRRTYQTVLEVVRYDPRTQESVVCSGWGTRADWYRNIMANGAIAMETGGKRYEKPSCLVLASEENYSIVAGYVRRLPAMARPMAYRLGLDVRGPEDVRRAHSQRLLMVALRPGATGTSARIAAPEAAAIPADKR